MNRNGPGPKDEQANNGQEVEFEPEFFDFTDLSRRTKNMHEPKLILEIGSYFGLLTAVAGDISVKVATEALGGESGAALFNIGRLKPGSKDLVAFPTREKGPASIEASWPDKLAGGRLDLQYLLQAYPVKIPKGHRALVPVARYDSAKYGPGLIFKFSEVRYGRISPRPVSKTKQTTPPPADSAQQQGA